MDYKIQREIASIDALFNLCTKIDDEEIQAHFAKYLCVKVSGLFENCIIMMIRNYVSKSSSKLTTKFVNTQMKNFTNVKFERLQSLLASFDEQWKVLLDEKFKDNKLKETLNSIVSNRHNIAHYSNNDSVSFHRLEKQYVDVKKIIEIVDNIVK